MNRVEIVVEQMTKESFREKSCLFCKVRQMAHSPDIGKMWEEEAKKSGRIPWVVKINLLV